MSIIYRRHETYPNHILIRYFIEKVSVAQIIKSWKYLLENKMINPQIKGVINNLEGCKLEMDMEGFKTLMNFLSSKKELHGIKLAVVCDCPENIVFPMRGEFEQNQLQIKPFTLMESAVKWII